MRKTTKMQLYSSGITGKVKQCFNSVSEWWEKCKKHEGKTSPSLILELQQKNKKNGRLV